MFHHDRSLVVGNAVEAKCIETSLQKTDILTKSLGALKLVSNRLLLVGE